MTKSPCNAKPPEELCLTAGKDVPRATVDRDYDETQTMHAWERFLTGGSNQGHLSVRHVIERSWSRSVSSGVDARAARTPLVADDEQLDQNRRQNRHLLAAADQTFQHAAELLEETSAMVVLTDRKGVILDTRGDNRTLDAGQNIKLEPGGNWNEEVVGTNGIGTALSTGAPVFVHAAEHFCEGIKAWTCAGAPIRDPFDQSIIGLIDISGPPEIFRRHNVALAVLAAEKIEFALGEQTRAERLRLLEACLSSVPVGNGTDGMVVLDRQGRIIHVNHRSLPLRAKLAEGFDLSVGSHLVDLGETFEERTIVERLPEGLRPAWLKPLEIGGDLSGAVLIYTASGRHLHRQAPPPAGITAPNRSNAPDVPEILGDSAHLETVIAKAMRAAKGRTPVLVEGETGVGKELFAKLIHTQGSPDGGAPFIAFNCGAVSKDLLGAELFGHVAGAFTGAAREGRAGRFELADGGTLCLDEIGELPLDLQPYLLRVLEENAVYRLGDGKPRSIDVRLVALTNRNLKDEVAAGRFRRDLYFRISTITLDIPPLRERDGDIDQLVDHFNGMFAIKYDVEPLAIDRQAREALRLHDWPGNVRELRNLIESLILMATGREIDLFDLPPDIASKTSNAADGTAAPLISASLEDTERQAIKKAIEAGNSNLSHVAKTLKISRSTLYRKMRHYGLQR